MDDVRSLTFNPIPAEGWHHADTLTYTIAPLDIQGKSGISVLLHTEDYAYANIALDIAIAQDTLLYSQRQEFTLDQCTPSKGIGRRYDYTLTITNIALCDTLPTTITLTHQLDTSPLCGIREVGIRINHLVHMPGEVVWKVDWH